MASMTITKRVDAPVELTFAAFTDLDHAAANVSDIVRIERLSKGPMHVGTRWRETRRVRRREATEDLEVSAFGRNEYYTVVSDSCGPVISSTFRFVRRGTATDVVLELDVSSTPLVDKLRSPVDRIMMSAMRGCVQQTQPFARCSTSRSTIRSVNSLVESSPPRSRVHCLSSMAPSRERRKA